MRTARLELAVLAGCLIFSAAASAAEQAYPYRPVRIVTQGTGGGNDLISRLIAQGITGSLGQSVIVENRPAGFIPGDIVARALPDGYTLLLAAGTHWVGTLLQKAPYDPIADFAPISAVGSAPNILVVHPSVPVKSVKELIELAKSKPGGLNYSTGGTGGSTHLAGELFNAMAGVKLVRIAYKSGAQETADLLGGHVQVAFSTATSVLVHVNSGKLRGLAVTTAQPSALVPGLPTIAASGLPGYQTGAIYGMLAAAKVTPAVVERLNREITRYLSTTEAKAAFLKIGVDAAGSTPQEFGALIKSEMQKWAKVIKDAGIKAD